MLTVMILITWMTGKAELSGIGISLMVSSLALIKGLLIGGYFMGLRSVPGLRSCPGGVL